MTGQPQVREEGLDGTLALARRLVAAARALAVQLGLDDLGAIDLPPVTGSAAAQANLRAAAPLYLAAELEATRLVPAMEMLAGLFASGALAADLGPGGPVLIDAWRRRDRRFGPRERRAFFSRLFGDTSGPAMAGPGGANRAFEPLLIDLAEALYRLQPADWRFGRPPQAALAAAAGALAANLAPRAGGMTAYAAADMVASVQRAVDLFKVPAVQAAVGASSLWTAVRNVARTYLREDPDIGNHLTRGKSGQLLLAWLADALPRLQEVSATLAEPGDPAVAAAAAWLQATLSLREREGVAARSA